MYNKGAYFNEKRFKASVHVKVLLLFNTLFLQYFKYLGHTSVLYIYVFVILQKSSIEEVSIFMKIIPCAINNIIKEVTLKIYQYTFSMALGYNGI